MKILILLSLVALCLAKRKNGFTAAPYPGQPNVGNDPHTFLRERYGDIGLMSWNPEGAQEQPEKVSAETHTLQNPNRRDVSIGNFPARILSGISKKAKHGNYISSNGENAAPTAKLEESSTSKENSPPVASQEQKQNRRPRTVNPAQEKYFIMGYGREQSSSSSSSSSSSEQRSSDSSGQRSKSTAAINQQEFSSSEENAAPAGKHKESISSAKSNAPAANQEEPLFNIKHKSSFDNKVSTSSNDNISNVKTLSSDRSASAQSTSENEANEEVDAETNVKPLLVGKRRMFVGSAPRRQAFSFKPMGHFQTAAPSKVKAPGSRPIREVDSFPDLKIRNSKVLISEPQGQTKKGIYQRRGKISAKK